MSLPFKQAQGGSHFVYDLDQLGPWLESIQKSIDPADRIFYAVKANPLSAIINTAHKAGWDFDFASLGELQQLLGQGVPADRLIATGPAKSKSYLGECLNCGVQLFELESLQQCQDLENLCLEKSLHADALLRLQIDWTDSQASILGGNSITAFGLDAEEWKKLAIKELQHVRILGIHSFQWGNIQDIDRLQKIWWRCAEEAKELSDSLGFKLQILDLGGGLGVDYKTNTAMDFSPIPDLMASLKKEFAISSLYLELGRLAVAPCGRYFTRIVDRKTVRGKELLVLEGGSNHLLRPALTGESFPVKNVSRESEESLNFLLKGPLCTGLDHLAALPLPATTEPGDWLEFSLCGAYAYTESMPFFLCHPGATESVLQNGETTLLRQAQKPEEYLR